MVSRGTGKGGKHRGAGLFAVGGCRGSDAARSPDNRGLLRVRALHRRGSQEDNKSFQRLPHGRIVGDGARVRWGVGDHGHGRGAIRQHNPLVGSHCGRLRVRHPGDEPRPRAARSGKGDGSTCEKSMRPKTTDATSSSTTSRTNRGRMDPESGRRIESAAGGRKVKTRPPIPDLMAHGQKQRRSHQAGLA